MAGTHTFLQREEEEDAHKHRRQKVLRSKTREEKTLQGINAENQCRKTRAGQEKEQSQEDSGKKRKSWEPLTTFFLNFSFCSKGVSGALYLFCLRVRERMKKRMKERKAKQAQKLQWKSRGMECFSSRRFSWSRKENYKERRSCWNERQQKNRKATFSSFEKKKKKRLAFQEEVLETSTTINVCVF